MVAVEVEAAQKAKSHMADVVESIRGVLTQITHTVESSRGGFAGDAANKFKDVADQWDTEVKTLNDRLDDLHGKVGDGTNKFANVDIDNEEAFKTALTNLG